MYVWIYTTAAHFGKLRTKEAWAVLEVMLMLIPMSHLPLILYELGHLQRPCASSILHWVSSNKERFRTCCIIGSITQTRKLIECMLTCISILIFLSPILYRGFSLRVFVIVFEAVV